MEFKLFRARYGGCCHPSNALIVAEDEDSARDLIYTESNKDCIDPDDDDGYRSYPREDFSIKHIETLDVSNHPQAEIIGYV